MKSSIPIVFSALVLAGGAALIADQLEDTLYVPLDHKAIRYEQAATTDPVALLEKRLEKGEVKLAYDPRWGYLPALLKQFGIRADSQLLVYSPTSLQARLISRHSPRALYFNDSVAVGFVHTSDVLELASFDPRNGVIFYTLDSDETAKPSFGRRDDCLRCHQGPQTLGVPGLMISSVIGSQNSPHGSAYETDQRVAFEKRWGGWFVTGVPVGLKHLGASIPEDAAEGFDPAAFLAPTSDVVALMTLEHQARMANLITRIGWDTRIAEADGKLESSKQDLDFDYSEMVEYMMFADEVPLPRPIAGDSAYAKSFAQLGPRDKQGRSLRDFDLKTHVFRYPLSYMIYSEAFDTLPALAKDQIYRRVYDVLTGKNTDEHYAGISAADRQAVIQIVAGTKSDLPPYWK